MMHVTRALKICSSSWASRCFSVPGIVTSQAIHLLEAYSCMVVSLPRSDFFVNAETRAYKSIEAMTVVLQPETSRFHSPLESTFSCLLCIQQCSSPLSSTRCSSPPRPWPSIPKGIPLPSIIDSLTRYGCVCACLFLSEITCLI